MYYEIEGKCVSCVRSIVLLKTTYCVWDVDNLKFTAQSLKTDCLSLLSTLEWLLRVALLLTITTITSVSNYFHRPRPVIIIESVFQIWRNNTSTGVNIGFCLLWEMSLWTTVHTGEG